MEKERHILTEEEKKQIVENRKDELSEEELNTVSGGWLWQDTVSVKTWDTEAEVRFCFSIGERVKILTFFGDGDWGTVTDRKAKISTAYDNRWIDMYYVQYDDGDGGWNGRANFLWLDEYN